MSTTDTTVTSNSTTAPRGRPRRRTVTVALMATTLAAALFLGGAEPASAEIVSARAAMGCSTGRVIAYPPAPNQTRGSIAWANVYTLAELYGWNTVTQRWQYVTHSGWWAYTATTQDGSLGYMFLNPPVVWAAGNNYGLQYTFNVTSGVYYAVRTWVYDSGDRTSRGIWNVVGDINTSSATYCRA